MSSSTKRLENLLGIEVVHAQGFKAFRSLCGIDEVENICPGKNPIGHSTFKTVTCKRCIASVVSAGWVGPKAPVWFK